MKETFKPYQRCESLLAVRARFLQKLQTVGGSVRLHSLVEGLFSSPYVRVADLPEKLGVSYPTAQADVDRLVTAKILRRLKGVTPKTYFAPDVYRVAYEDLGEA